MTAATLESLLRDFRRSMAMARALRLLLLALFALGLIWAIGLPEKESRQLIGLMAIGGLVLWAAVLGRSVRLSREVQTGNMLMALGRLDDAEACLGRAMGRFSLSSQVKYLVFHQLAALLFQRKDHAEAVAICRELLKHPMNGLRTVWINRRLLLADTLLLQNQIVEAYDVVRPVYDAPLTLVDRMRLLPIQLRYELAAGHAESAVQGLAEKVQIAELLETERAGLVHALLAEACRRLAMGPQQAFLAERARLYCDLLPLAEQYPAIMPIAAGPAAADGSAGQLSG